MSIGLSSRVVFGCVQGGGGHTKEINQNVPQWPALYYRSLNTIKYRWQYRSVCIR